jgi:antitoxin (DNA-binding transcriptional repressor) of toxin-antitoxin stability system
MMEKLTLTALRQNLFRVVDRVLETGIPVAIERQGKTVLLTPQDAPPKLSRLKRRKLIKGDPQSLVDVKVARWREPRKLK